jgi:hypothetical protein
MVHSLTTRIKPEIFPFMTDIEDEPFELSIEALQGKWMVSYSFNDPLTISMSL